jgi:hypothetical protein
MKTLSQMTRVWAHGSEATEATAGAFQTTFGGGAFDVFVSKLNRSGSALVYSTTSAAAMTMRALELQWSGATCSRRFTNGPGNAYVNGPRIQIAFQPRPEHFRLPLEVHLSPKSARLHLPRCATAFIA